MFELLTNEEQKLEYHLGEKFMQHQEYQLLNALSHILKYGELREDRTGVGRISSFGITMRFDLSKDFPAVTTKKIAWQSMCAELLWFLRGQSDERELASILRGSKNFDLNDKKTHTIWTDNLLEPQWRAKQRKKSYNEFDLGKIYGVQWRSWPTSNGNSIDQIQKVIESIKSDPFSTRHVVSAWNVEFIDEDMALPPCHTLFQFYVNSKKELSCHLFQRSADMFLGVPFNIASYSLLIHMIASECGLKPGEFLHSITDAHIYCNHVEQVKEQIKRVPLDFAQVKIPENFKMNNINQYSVQDFGLINYQSHSAILAPMASQKN